MLTARVVWMFSIGALVLSAGGVSFSQTTGTGSGRATSTGSGQAYPNKPIRVVVGAAGGGSDFIARIIAQGISSPLGQPVIIDNRQATLTGEIVSRAPPDGHTLHVGGASLWILPLLQKMPYDVVSDFSPISLIAREVSVFAVNPAVPAKSIKELIALAKAKAGQLNNASGSIGGAGHLAGELFKSMAGVSIVHVPYKGNQLAITALISGEIQLVILDAGLLMPHVKAGRLRGLAVTSAEPTALAPELPTVAASGLPGYEAVGMTGAFAAGKPPVAIINRLNQEIIRVLNLPDVKERLLNAAEEVVASSPERFAAIMKSDIDKWSKVIKDVGIKTN